MAKTIKLEYSESTAEAYVSCDGGGGCVGNLQLSMSYNGTEVQLTPVVDECNNDYSNVLMSFEVKDYATNAQIGLTSTTDYQTALIALDGILSGIAQGTSITIICNYTDCCGNGSFTVQLSVVAGFPYVIANEDECSGHTNYYGYSVIYDLSGAIVYSTQSTVQERAIDVINLNNYITTMPSGTYYKVTFYYDDCLGVPPIDNSLMTTIFAGYTPFTV